MLLISGGVFMIVHMMFWGYSLGYFIMGGIASGLCCLVSSVAFLLFFRFLVYSLFSCSIHLRKLNINYSTGCPMKYTW